MDTLDTFTTGCSQAWGMLLFNRGSYASSAGRLFCSSRVLACGQVRCCLLACVRGRRSRPSIRKTTRLVLRSQLGHSRNLELLASDRHPISNPVFGRPKVPGRHRPRLEKSRRQASRKPEETTTDFFPDLIQWFHQVTNKAHRAGRNEFCGEGTESRCRIPS